MSRIKDLLTKYEIRPSKNLGQHFVSDPNTIQRILRFAFNSDALNQDEGPPLIVEVGAGLGALTLGLADFAKEVIAIEADKRLLPALEEVLKSEAKSNVKVLAGDAMETDFEELTQSRPYRLVANLPYNIAARLIIKVLEESPSAVELTVMVQKEVAEKFLAKPGDSIFGLLSLKAQFLAEIKSGGKISPNVFYPRPGVDSELLKLTPQKQPVKNPELIFELATTAFQKRRKMLRKSLEKSVRPEHFLAAGLQGSARPQELRLQDWDRLVQTVAGSSPAAPDMS